MLRTLVIQTKTGYKEIVQQVYHAPHKPEGTPRRPHRGRRWWDQQRFSVYANRPPVFGGRI